MKTDYSNMKMLDIVFEHRNKNYGAYVLRRDYNKSLAKAVSITVLSAFIFITGNFISSQFTNAANFVTNDGVYTLEEIILPKEEIEIPKEEPKPNEAQAKQTIENTEKNVVADDAHQTDSIPDKDDLAKYESGTTTNLDVAANTMGVDDGKGTLETLEPVEKTFVVEKNDPRDWADVMPEFPGGEKKLMEFLKKVTDYPAMEQDNGIEGRVLVRFVVNEDGSVSSPSLLKNDSPGFGREALRVVKQLPKFKPGLQRGKPVKVYFVLPFQWRQT